MNTKNIIAIISVVLILLAFSACTTYQYKPYNTPTGEVVNEQTGENANNEGATGENLSGEEKTEESALTKETKPDVEAYEGDLIDLKPFVMDPDGDEISLGYTKPFDENGIWQTKEGDAGLYSIIITATDNKASFVTKQMRIKVLIRNKPPVIEIADKVEFNEGDMIVLNPKVTDVDNTEVFVTYTGWMTSKTYQTTYEDAGSYEETVKADDGINQAYKDFTIVVKDVNRAPELNLLSEPKITVTEGDLIEIKAESKDPDGEKVNLTFSEPVTESGKWQTQKGDAGNHIIKVTASDGVNEVTKEVEIEVLKKNTAPVIDSVTVSPEEVVLKKPGDKVTVEIKVTASDVDEDKLEITYSGYMDSATKEIEYGEKGGVKTVTVTVSDGKESVSKDVSFNMNNWPCFDCQ